MTFGKSNIFNFLRNNLEKIFNEMKTESYKY